MAGSVGAVLDALPYIDNEFEDPELRESVRRIRYLRCDVLLRFSPPGNALYRRRNETVQADEELPRVLADAQDHVRIAAAPLGDGAPLG